MNYKKILASIFGIAFIGVGASIPITSEDLTFVYAYQYPVEDYQEYVVQPVNTATSTVKGVLNPHENYPDGDNNGFAPLSSQ